VASWRREPRRAAGTWTAYRQVGPGWPPLWHPGPFTQPTRQPSARWHDERQGQLAQYLSLDVDGAWAELVRNEHVRDEVHRRDLPRNLWACTIEEHDLADLSSFEEVEARGLDPALFVDDDHAPARALAGELRAHGYRGLICPSAALPGAINLTLFDGRRELLRHSRRAVGRNRRPELYVLCSEVADEALAPPHVLSLARYLGEPYDVLA
jgi:RES domain-containing protein